MILYQDPVTRRHLTAELLAAERAAWAANAAALLDGLPTGRAQALAQAIYTQLNALGSAQRGERPPVPPCPHAPESNLIDHSFLTAALTYCLLPSDPQVHLLRLAAFTHEMPPEIREPLKAKLDPPDHALLAAAWALLDTQAERLTAADTDTLGIMAAGDQKPPDLPLGALWLAHLAAAQPLFNQILNCPDGTTLKVIARRADFQRHPLATLPPQLGQIGLVYGGATKVKHYVFESAKLPEIRGGSVLLDRLNLDYSQVLFAEAPECIIYAAGGDLLALAPVAVAQEKAAALEAAYTRATLSAQSVAAATTVTLLELQYGLAPQAYWADDYLQEVSDASGPNRAKQALLRSYYGDPTHKAQPGWRDEMLFHLRKCFGEAVGAVALKRLQRREGNYDDISQSRPSSSLVGDRTADDMTVPPPAVGVGSVRPLLHFETLPHGQFCSSCDRRTAVVRIPDLADDLCEPCLRKRWIGWRTRYGRQGDLPREIQRTEEAMKGATDWRPDHFEEEVGTTSFNAWHHAFQDYLDQALGDDELSTDRPADIVALRRAYLANLQGVAWESRTPIDGPSLTYPGIWPAYTFTEIGQAADPDGYIGIVYADGNNVGALIERIRTPAEYRQFAQRLFHANQRAVFEALARHLRPAVVRDDKDQTVLIHPFEIISIGGDDLVLVLPAEKALPVALAISNTLEALFATDGPLVNHAMGAGATAEAGQSAPYALTATKAQRLNSRLVDDDAPADAAHRSPIDLPGAPAVSMATGVVLAAHTTPFYFLTEIVEELLKSAKKKAKRQKSKGDYGSTIDFMALKSVAMITTRVASFRQIALTERKEHDILHLTARPYTTTEAAALVDAIQMLKVADFPRSQLYQLRELLPQGRFATSLGYLYFTSRLKRGWTAVMRRNLDDLWCHPTREPAPWMRQEGNSQDISSWETVLGDLIELYDFVPKPGSGAAHLAEGPTAAPLADPRAVAPTQPQRTSSGEVMNG